MSYFLFIHLFVLIDLLRLGSDLFNNGVILGVISDLLLLLCGFGFCKYFASKFEE